MVIYVIFGIFIIFQHIQVNRLDFNVQKCWQMCHYLYRALRVQTLHGSHPYSSIN